MKRKGKARGMTLPASAPRSARGVDSSAGIRPRRSARRAFPPTWVVHSTVDAARESWCIGPAPYGGGGGGGGGGVGAGVAISSYNRLNARAAPAAASGPGWRGGAGDAGLPAVCCASSAQSILLSVRSARGIECAAAVDDSNHGLLPTSPSSSMSVRVSVCQRDNPGSYGRIWMKFLRSIAWHKDVVIGFEENLLGRTNFAPSL